MLQSMPTQQTTLHIGKQLLVAVGAILLCLTLMSGAVAAQDGGNSSGGGLTEDQNELKNTLQSIGNFVSLIVLGIAVPNGAYGMLQYMTAGPSVEQDEKGRTRVRNTFIALAGVAVLQLAVRVFTTYVGGVGVNDTASIAGIVTAFI